MADDETNEHLAILQAACRQLVTHWRKRKHDHYLVQHPRSGIYRCAGAEAQDNACAEELERVLAVVAGEAIE